MQKTNGCLIIHYFIPSWPLYSPKASSLLHLVPGRQDATTTNFQAGLQGLFRLDATIGYKGCSNVRSGSLPLNLLTTTTLELCSSLTQDIHTRPKRSLLHCPPSIDWQLRLPLLAFASSSTRHVHDHVFRPLCKPPRVPRMHRLPDGAGLHG